jgi:hypothetical protein
VVQTADLSEVEALRQHVVAQLPDPSSSKRT